MRILIGQAYQEGSSFCPLVSTRADFERLGLFFGEEILTEQADVGEIAGFVRAAAAAGDVELVPTLRANGGAGGLVEAGFFDFLKEDLRCRVRAAGRLDGVLFSMHGAMAVQGFDDPEGALLRLLRAELGDALPIALSLDAHAIVTSAMVEACDIIVGYQTCPHVDLEETGERAARLLFEAVRTGKRPRLSACHVPILIPNGVGDTRVPGPLSDVFASAWLLEQGPGVLSASVFPAFPFTDAAEMSSCLLVCVDPGCDEGAALASGLALQLWEARERLCAAPPLAAAALDEALAFPQRPVAVTDVGDNVLGGAPGDGTRLLGALMERGGDLRIFAVLRDPRAVARAAAEGEGATLTLEVGASLAPQFSGSLRLEGVVRRVVHDAHARVEGPVERGGAFEMGTAVHLAAGGLDLVLVEEFFPAHDPSVFRAVGVDPAEADVLLLKNVHHCKANFAGIAKAFFPVDMGGLTTDDLASIPYRRIPRPMYPLDREFAWEPDANEPEAIHA